MEDWDISERIEAAKQRLKELKLPLNTASELEIQAWEKQWGVELPRTYRRFINEAANGFESRNRQMISLQECMTTDRGTEWAPEDVPSDFLKTPFPHKEFYNPDFAPGIEAANELSDKEYAKWWLNQLRGTILLEAHDDATSTFLIVNGPSRGEVWSDLTAVGQGYDRLQWTFFDWVKSAL